MRWPFSPQASSIRPAPSSWSGFLKTLPNVRLFVGCAALRCAFSSRTVRLDLLRRPRRQPQLGLERRPGPAEARVPVREAELVGRQPAGPVRGRRRARARAPARSRRRRRRRSSRCRRRSCPGIAHANSKPPRPAARARCRHDRVRGAAAGAQQVAVDLDRGELARELEHERVDARRRRRAGSTRGRSSRRQARSAAQRAPRARRPSSGCANARAGPPVPSVVYRESRRSSITQLRSSGTARSTSPAPRVRIVSPGRAQPRTRRAASSSVGRPAERMPGPHARELVDDRACRSRRAAAPRAPG